MVILGLMRLASWLSGEPDLGSKLLEMPKHLIPVLPSKQESAYAQSLRPTLQTLFSAVHNSYHFKLTATSLDSSSSEKDHSIQGSWLETIETLLFTPESTHLQVNRDAYQSVSFVSADPARPMSQFLEMMQNLFWELP